MSKNKKSLWAEFREFINKGNVMDMAVGVIIGGAFKSIVDSLVNDLFMPLVSRVTGGVDFTTGSFRWTATATIPLRRLRRPAPPPSTTANSLPWCSTLYCLRFLCSLL